MSSFNFPLPLRTQGGAGNDYFSVISVFALSCGEIRLASPNENQQLDSSRHKNLPVILSIGGWVRSLDSTLRVMDCAPG
jgi:putative intracellular protease/amidase